MPARRSTMLPYPARTSKLSKLLPACTQSTVRSSLIPSYNSLEAREDLVEEVSHQFYEESIQARKDIDTIEYFIKHSDPYTQQNRYRVNMLNVAAAKYEPNTRWTFQELVEHFMEYTQKDKQVKEIAIEALRMEQKVHQMWEEVAYIRNKQGSLLQWLWENELHEVIKTVVPDIGKEPPPPPTREEVARAMKEAEVEQVED